MNNDIHARRQVNQSPANLKLIKNEMTAVTLHMLDSQLVIACMYPSIFQSIPMNVCMEEDANLQLTLILPLESKPSNWFTISSIVLCTSLSPPTRISRFKFAFQFSRKLDNTFLIQDWLLSTDTEYWQNNYRKIGCTIICKRMGFACWRLELRQLQYTDLAQTSTIATSLIGT